MLIKYSENNLLYTIVIEDTSRRTDQWSNDKYCYVKYDVIYMTDYCCKQWSNYVEYIL